jgi:hypothetical protein
MAWPHSRRIQHQFSSPTTPRIAIGVVYLIGCTIHRDQSCSSDLLCLRCRCVPWLVRFLWRPPALSLSGSSRRPRRLRPWSSRQAHHRRCVPKPFPRRPKRSLRRCIGAPATGCGMAQIGSGHPVSTSSGRSPRRYGSQAIGSSNRPVATSGLTAIGEASRPDVTATSVGRHGDAAKRGRLCGRITRAEHDASDSAASAASDGCIHHGIAGPASAAA